MVKTAKYQSRFYLNCTAYAPQYLILLCYNYNLQSPPNHPNRKTSGTVPVERTQTTTTTIAIEKKILFSFYRKAWAKYDRLSDDAFSRIWVARSFISEYLSPEDLSLIDLDTLESVQDDHTTPALVEFFSDSVYVALTPDGAGRVYIILEHKSYIDHKVGIQIMANIVMLHQYHKRQHGSGAPSPVILSVLIYHGQTNWSSDSHPLINFTLPQELKTFSPDLRFTFCDLSRTPKDSIRGIFILKILFLSFKYVRHPDLITPRNTRNAYGTRRGT